MTAPAARALYRGLWRQVRRFQDEALPITGVVGLDAGPVCLDPLARLRAAFGGGGGGGDGGGDATTTTTRLSEGLQALRTLPHQAAALEHAEEDARALLARWAQLQARWAELRRRRRNEAAASSSSPSPSSVNTQVLEAGEEACALAYAATEEQAAENALDDDEADEIRARARRVLALADPAGQGGGGSEAARDLAERARRAAASSLSTSPSSRYPTAHVQAAAAASAALFAYNDDDDGANSNNTPDQGRLRSEPVEWVYDGIEAALPQPLLAGEVAHSESTSTSGTTSSGPPSRAARKGVPLALALAAARCLVDAKLPGLMRCEPVCARDKDAEMLAAGKAEQRGSGGGVNAGPLLSALPAAVAARQAGLTVAVAPATNTWLVRLDIGGGDSGSSWYVDVTKRGELLSADEAKGRYPSLQTETNDDEERATLALWREVARTLVLAHQRRGEADAVASWMRAAMALDPAAAEWGRVL